MDIQKIPVKNIKPNDYNPNYMSEEEYERLKEGIRLTNGKYVEDNPILIRPLDTENEFEMIDGFHRWKAFKELGFDEIGSEIKKCTRQEAQILSVILNKDRGNLDYLQLSKIFYENWKGIGESKKETTYDWEKQRLEKKLHAPGTLKQDEIGKVFGYSEDSIGNILRLSLNIEENTQKTLIYKGFSNLDKLNIARVEHPILQLGLVENCFNEKNKRVWDSNKISSMATFYNKVWDEVKQLDVIEDQNEILQWIIDNKKEHMKDVKVKIDMVLARLQGPLYTDDDLGLNNFNPETSTRWDIGARAKWGNHALFPEKKYHGNYPPQLARNLIWKYSNPNNGELILDPFVGSGTTLIETKTLGQKGIGLDVSIEALDVAKEMIKFRVENRKYFEPLLFEWDARKLTELKDEKGELLLPPNSVDLVVTHPPYWDMVRWSDKGLESLSFDDFCKGMKIVFQQMYKVIKPEHFCCIVIGDVYRRDGGVETLIDHFLTMAKDVGFKVYDIAIKFSEGQESMGGLMDWRAKEHNFLIPMHDFVLIFKKGAKK